MINIGNRNAVRIRFRRIRCCNLRLGARHAKCDQRANDRQYPETFQKFKTQSHGSTPSILTRVLVLLGMDGSQPRRVACRPICVSYRESALIAGPRRRFTPIIPREAKIGFDIIYHSIQYSLSPIGKLPAADLCSRYLPTREWTILKETNVSSQVYGPSQKQIQTTIH